MSAALTAQTAGLRSLAAAFLNFCRVEKGLSGNSISAYSADLNRFVEFSGDGPPPGTDVIRNYIDHLYREGLGNGSIARHLTTLGDDARPILRLAIEGYRAWGAIALADRLESIG